jgi:hypothetical protein
MSAFSQLASKLAAQGVKNPQGAAYSIGVKAHGKSAMSEAAAKKESVQAVLRQRRGKGK